MIYIGVDPGTTGVVAALTDTREIVLMLRLAGATPSGIQDAILRAVGGDMCHVYVEKVSATPQMGVCSAFTFGGAKAMIETVLDLSGLAWRHVTPKQWRKGVGLSSRGGVVGGAEYSLRKTQAWELASELFAPRKVHKYAADALLIAEYGRLQNSMQGAAT